MAVEKPANRETHRLGTDLPNLTLTKCKTPVIIQLCYGKMICKKWLISFSSRMAYNLNDEALFERIFTG